MTELIKVQRLLLARMTDDTIGVKYEERQWTWREYQTAGRRACIDMH